MYTRKSSEEGLEQEFNSLDAQREACEAYVRSQKHEGWQALAQLYDDPGYSGGNMERPALKRLLTDIAAKQIDVVVVYKVDRLTRSLADFAKIVEVFDANAVSFVSITQAFSTTTSMGRLTLNVLLSFAQFEREVTGERIRDKIAASKKKGLWMGGQPALGYDVRDRKLVVNEAEAETVRAIFRRYLDLGSVRELKMALDAGGVVSKRRTAADGSAYGGQSFSRGALYQMLQNRIYRGETVHKGAAYPGEHPPIVDEALWSAVQRKLETNGVDRRTSREAAKQAYLLAGVVYDANSESMTPTHAVKKGVRYRYYVSRRLIADVRKGDKRDPEAGQRLPAAELERLIVERCGAFFADPQAVLEALPSGRTDAPRRKKAIAAARDVAATIASEGGERTFGLLRLEMKFVCSGDDNGVPPDAALVRLLVRAHSLARRLAAGPGSTLEDAGALEGMGAPYAARLMRLNSLAPEIVTAILNGRQPVGLTASKLMADTRLPLDWTEQRRILGFA
ncbi:MAG TPA: recombinase family protein [Methylocystis sp.]|nr:recombinase family protein [Methylocystis sp.]